VPQSLVFDYLNAYIRSLAALIVIDVSLCMTCYSLFGRCGKIKKESGRNKRLSSRP
jgi:hypothetical protein